MNISSTDDNTLHENRESIRHNNSEKQISVDPISLRSSSDQETNPHNHPLKDSPPSTPPPPPSPPKAKFLSCSLPSSASSSPRHHFVTKPKPPPSSTTTTSKIHRHHSVALSNLERLRESHMRRSKSYGEGRSYQPSIDFDIVSKKLQKHEKTAPFTSFPSGSDVASRGNKEREEEFKCGALCLFLPGFGKGKASVVRARKDSNNDEAATIAEMASVRASLEKFECGSWRSSAAAITNGEDGTNQGLFFDLPLELIRCSSVNDTESPVTTAFVFDDKDRERGILPLRARSSLLKGVLKHSSTNGSNSGGCSNSSSSRHVRFSVSSSTSPPTYQSIATTPRFDKEMDDFSAFLEAQNSLQ